MQDLVAFVERRFRSDYLDIDFQLLFKIFPRLLILYFALFFATIDWEFYQLANNDLFKSIDGLGFLVQTLPSRGVLRVLLIFFLILGAISFWSLNFVAFFIFSILVVFFDLLHNSFGFVNVQTHAIFYLTVCLFALSKWGGDRENQFWVFRFIEVIFVLVYFQSAISKLVKSGLSWGIEGTTLQFALFRQGQALGIELSQYSELCIFLSIVTLGVELLFPFLYFFLLDRRWMMILSISFHLGTYVLMGIHFFHLWVFPLSYLVTIGVRRMSCC